MRSFLLGFVVASLIAGPAVVLIRGEGAAVPVPVAVGEARAAPPVRVPPRPPNADELAFAFCGVRLSQARLAPHCTHGLMRLYRACGLDGRRPKTARCRPLLRRLARADRRAQRR